MAKRYTVEEIAYKNQEAGGHYFDEDTLEGFNQRLEDFKVLEYGGRVFVYAQSRGYELMGETIRPWSVTEIDVGTGRTKSVGLNYILTLDPKTTSEEIAKAIKAHVDQGGD